MKTNEKMLRRALEMAIAEYEFRLDAACGVTGGKVSDNDAFAKERAKVYIRRAGAEIKGERK